MTSVKVKFRPSTREGKAGRVYYQVGSGNALRQVKSPYRLSPREWEAIRGNARPTPEHASPLRETELQETRRRIRKDVQRLGKIAAAFEQSAMPYSPSDIVDRFRELAETLPLTAFMRRLVTRLEQAGRHRTSETYEAALNTFLRFRDGQDIMMDEIDTGTIASYEAYLKGRGLTMNTVSFYMRVLRAAYNRAVDKGIIEQGRPFRHAYTGIGKTVKRAVSLGILKKMKGMDLSGSPALDFARDMFMFSFYTRGMSFVDMAYLRQSDLRDGTLTYRRRKTGQQLTIRWEACMQHIVDKYPATGTGFLLPIIRKKGGERRQYKNALHLVNNKLKIISGQLHLSPNLTMYAARHSWASIAKSRHIPLPVISEGMGHGSESTTRIYLASLENSVIDKANAAILKSL